MYSVYEREYVWEDLFIQNTASQIDADSVFTQFMQDLD